MAPPKKSASQVIIAAPAKGKSVVVGGTGVVHPPFRPDVHSEDVIEEQPSQATMLEVGTNQPETRLLAEGQLLQMLASLQK